MPLVIVQLLLVLTSYSDKSVATDSIFNANSQTPWFDYQCEIQYVLPTNENEKVLQTD